jgi:hypothetical protein
VSTTVFEPIRYTHTRPEQWQQAAEAWHRWGPTLRHWLGPGTRLMLEAECSGRGYAQLGNCSREHRSPLTSVHALVCVGMSKNCAN